MKDFFVDLVWNWKHAMSSDNTKGTRGFCIFIFVTFCIAVIGGLSSAIVALVIHKVVLAIVGAVVMVVGIVMFAIVSAQ